VSEQVNLADGGTTLTITAFNPRRYQDVCGVWTSLVSYCGAEASVCPCNSGAYYVPDQFNSLAAGCATLIQSARSCPGPNAPVDPNDYWCSLHSIALANTDYCPTDVPGTTTDRFAAKVGASVTAPQTQASATEQHPVPKTQPSATDQATTSTSSDVVTQPDATSTSAVQSSDADTSEATFTPPSTQQSATASTVAGSTSPATSLASRDRGPSAAVRVLWFVLPFLMISVSVHDVFNVK